MNNDFFKSLTQVPKSPKSLAPQEVQQNVDAIKQLVGLTTRNMDETLISDIEDLIKKKIYMGLDGYLHCLSRIMKHEIAWGLIEEAYKLNAQKPPAKYEQLFGRNKAGAKKVEQNSGWKVG